MKDIRYDFRFLYSCFQPKLLFTTKNIKQKLKMQRQHLNTTTQASSIIFSFGLGAGAFVYLNVNTRWNKCLPLGIVLIYHVSIETRQYVLLSCQRFRVVQFYLKIL